jgi:hypothetical protein
VPYTEPSRSLGMRSTPVRGNVQGRPHRCGRRGMRRVARQGNAMPENIDPKKGAPETGEPEMGDTDETTASTRDQAEWSREEYAIHARRSELPLFGQAVAGDRDDNSWLNKLSGSIGAATKAAADPTAAQAKDALSRRPRRSED